MAPQKTYDIKPPKQHLASRDARKKAAHKRQDISGRASDKFIPRSILLAEEIFYIKPPRSKARRVFGYSWRFTTVLFLALYLVGGITPFTALRNTIGAFTVEEKVAHFYATDCADASGWTNTFNAQGQPQLSPTAALDIFSDLNSATYVSGPSSLTCKIFRSDDAPSLITNNEQGTENNEQQTENPSSPEATEGQGNESASPTDEDSPDSNGQIPDSENNPPSEPAEEIISDVSPEDEALESVGGLPAEALAQDETISEESLPPEVSSELVAQDTPQPEEPATQDETDTVDPAPEPIDEEESVLQDALHQLPEIKSITIHFSLAIGEKVADLFLDPTSEPGSEAGNVEGTSETQENLEEDSPDSNGQIPNSENNPPSEPAEEIISDVSPDSETSTDPAEGGTNTDGAEVLLPDEPVESDTIPTLDEIPPFDQEASAESTTISFWKKTKNVLAWIPSRIARAQEPQNNAQAEQPVEEPEQNLLVEQGDFVDSQPPEEEPELLPDVSEEPQPEPEGASPEVISEEPLPASEEPSPEVILPILDGDEPTPESDPSTQLPELDTRIILSYSTDGTLWYRLGTLATSQLSNALNGGYFSYEAPFLTTWDDIENLLVRVEGVVGGQTTVITYLDSVWTEVTYLETDPRQGGQGLFPLSPRDDFKDSDTPSFRFRYEKLRRSGVEQITDTLGLTDYWSGVDLRIQLRTSRGDLMDLDPDDYDISFESGGEFSLTLTKAPIAKKVLATPHFKKQLARWLNTDEDDIVRQLKNDPLQATSSQLQATSSSLPTSGLRPGQYALILTITDETGFTETFEEDFSWGVLAMNVNKSIYTPQDTNAYIQMGVVSQFGQTICSASMTLLVTDPAGTTSVFTTSTTSDAFIEATQDLPPASLTNPGVIILSPECSGNSKTSLPDYWAHYALPSQTGVYTLSLTAKTWDGTHTIIDSFEVRDPKRYITLGAILRGEGQRAFFDVERFGPTRIYPPATYEVRFKITPYKDFRGEIVETAPASFTILERGQRTANTERHQVREGSGVKEIVWSVQWKAGTEYELMYRFRAPNLSPYLHLLGPLSFHETSIIQQTIEENQNFLQPLLDLFGVGGAPQDVLSADLSAEESALGRPDRPSDYDPNEETAPQEPEPNTNDSLLFADSGEPDTETSTTAEGGANTEEVDLLLQGETTTDTGEILTEAQPQQLPTSNFPGLALARRGGQIPNSVFTELRQWHIAADATVTVCPDSDGETYNADWTGTGAQDYTQTNDGTICGSGVNDSTWLENGTDTATCSSNCEAQDVADFTVPVGTTIDSVDAGQRCACRDADTTCSMAGETSSHLIRVASNGIAGGWTVPNESAGFADHLQNYTDAPGSSGWSQTQINDMEVGGIPTGLDDGEFIKCTEFWAVINYTPPPDSAPTVATYTDAPEPVAEGSAVTFTVGWEDTEAALEWTQATAGAQFPGRYYHTSLVFNNQMWVIGGGLSAAGECPSGADSRCNDVWYSTDGTDWTQATAGAQFPARFIHTSLIFNNPSGGGQAMWVIGGDLVSDECPSGATFQCNDVWYSTDGTDWTQATAGAQLPARDGSTSLVFNNRMWVMGGLFGTSCPSGLTRCNDVWYSTDGTDWTLATAGAQFPGRDESASLVFNSRMWVIGGTTLSAGCPSGVSRCNDVWYSDDGTDWTQATAGAQFPGRSSPSSLVFNNQMWVIGGQTTVAAECPSGDSTARCNDVWYSTDGTDWTRAMPGAQFLGRYRHTSLVFNNQMWVIGGSVELSNCPSGATSICNDVWYASGELARTFICKTNVITNANSGGDCDTSQEWTSTASATSTEPQTPSYTTTSSDIGARAYYVFVCSDGGESDSCSENTPTGAIWRNVLQRFDGTGSVDSAQWSAREKLALLVFNNRMYLIGGTDFALQLHTGQTTNYRAGDDQSNDGTAKSYTDAGCGTGTVLDNHTGLCWQYDDQSARAWNDAIDYCDTLTLAGQSDWRLPTLYEGAIMFDYECAAAGGSCFGDYQNNALDWATAGGTGKFWLSTTLPDSTTIAYIADTDNGRLSNSTKTNTTPFVRCVRSAN